MRVAYHLNMGGKVLNYRAKEIMMNNPIKDLTKKGMAAVDKVDVAM